MNDRDLFCVEDIERAKVPPKPGETFAFLGPSPLGLFVKITPPTVVKGPSK